MFGVIEPSAHRFRLLFSLALLGVVFCLSAVPGRVEAQSAAGQAPAAQATNLDGLRELNDRRRTVNRRHPEAPLLRRALDAAGIKVAPTGLADSYDTALVEAIRAFQRREGLKPTGIPGAETRRRLANYFVNPWPQGESPSTPAAQKPAQAPAAQKPGPQPTVQKPPAGLPPSPVAPQPKTGQADDIDQLEELTDPRKTVNRPHPEVPLLRRALAAAGVQAVAAGPDDVYDKALVAAVRAFQEREGIRSTGLPGALTRERLAQYLAKRRPQAVPASAVAPAVVPLPPPPPGLKPARPAAPSTGAPAPSAATTDRPKPADRIEPMFEPASADRMHAAIGRYEAMNAAGGFRPAPPPPSGRAYRLDLDHPNVRQVIARLSAEGFLPANHPSGSKYDSAVAAAAMRFQASRGLRVDGRIGSATLKAMNAPLPALIQAMRASLERMERLPAALQEQRVSLAGPVVLVNAASLSLQYVEGGKLIHWENVVAGRPKRETPEFVAKLTYVQLNPTWTPTIRMIREKYAPAEEKKAGALAGLQMRPQRQGTPVDPATIKWANPPPWLEIVQRPGPHNSLGAIRFGHNNGAKTAYYMHGTPNTNDFDKEAAQRLLSSGCVRLIDPVPLAELLLRGAPGEWTAQRLRETIKAYETNPDHDHWKPGQRIEIAVAQRPAVIWTYLTAWATADGRVHFRDDLYGRDSD